MADVIHRTTLEYRRSVNTPDYAPETWLIDPDLSTVGNVPQRYWKLVGDVVSEMTEQENSAVDIAELAAAISAAKAGAESAIDGLAGYQLRAMASILLDEINALRGWITSFKAAVAAATSLANLQSRVAALSNTPDRTLSQAKTAYKNAIAGNGLDE